MSTREAEHDVVWHTPSRDSSGSMPLGNGDVGVNLWVEPSGDLLFYVSKSDAWSDWHRLLKVGRVRVSFSPNPLPEGAPFRQTLRLSESEVEILLGKIRVCARVDANHPLVRIEATGPRPFAMRASLEVWRESPRELRKEELHSAWVHSMFGKSSARVVQQPDTVLRDPTDRVAWYQRNESSIWASSLNHQGLGEWVAQGKDPLLHVTFGGAIFGEGFRKEGDTALASEKPRRRTALNVAVYRAQSPTAGEWVKGLDALVAKCRRLKPGPTRVAHAAWWRGFWGRSWVRPSGSPEAVLVGQAVTLQRYMQACAGRGGAPIKFNGSIFNVDGREPDRHHMSVAPVQPTGDFPDPLSAPPAYDADFRRWGGHFWLQNTRLLYWSMLASGDFEMVAPFFRLYREALPMAEFRCRKYHGHGGAFFPETISLWGGFADSDYGWDREGLAPHELTNTYMRWYWQGGIEVVATMLAWHEHTGDARFARETLLPFAGAIVEFYDRQYPRDANGRLKITPSQSLETWQKATNPLPDLAGLRWVLGHLLELPPSLIGERAAGWRRFLGELPPVPTREEKGRTVLAPAEKFDELKNMENPELYAIFPYPLYGVGRPDLEMARITFGVRKFKGIGGWMQDAIQAACLGLTGVARAYAVQAAGMRHDGSRFPAFWGPNYDWVPDQDHGSALILAVQKMLLQADGERILLLPAWPADWDVDFKLHAPQRTTVECCYRGGRIVKLVVMPAKRRKDVVAGGRVPVPLQRGKGALQARVSRV